MKYLLLDTCVWLDICKKDFKQKIYDNFINFILNKEVNIIIPEIIKEEWERNKDNLINNIIAEYNNNIKWLKKVKSFASVNDQSYIDMAISILSKSKRKIIEGTSNKIDQVEDIIYNRSNRTNIICIPLTEGLKTIVFDWGINKKAPCHRKTSIADATIFFAGIEYFKNLDNKESFFITHNNEDFSDKGNSINIHTDLQSIINSYNVKYYNNIGKYINDNHGKLISEEEIEEIEKLSIYYENGYTTYPLSYEACPLCRGKNITPGAYRPGPFGLTWQIYCFDCKRYYDTGEFWD